MSRCFLFKFSIRHFDYLSRAKDRFKARYRHKNTAAHLGGMLNVSHRQHPRTCHEYVHLPTEFHCLKGHVFDG